MVGVGQDKAYDVLPRKSAERDREILALHKAGTKAVAIAQRFGMTRQRIYQIIEDEKDPQMAWVCTLSKRERVLRGGLGALSRIQKDELLRVRDESPARGLL